MNTVRVLIGVSAVFLIPHSADAGGLVQKLPEDGSWVRYHLAQTSVREGVAGTENTGTFTIRSVGTVMEGGKPCRWLEFEYRFVDGEGKETGLEFIKILIPVENLNQGQKPLEHVVRAWRRFDTKNAKRIEDQIPGFADNLILSGPLLNRKMEVRTRVVDYQDGRLKLKNVVTGKADWSGRLSQRSRKKTQTSTLHQLWLHEDVPFGVAFARQELRFYSEGEHFRSVFRELTLSDFGTGAKTALPDAK